MQLPLPVRLPRLLVTLPALSHAILFLNPYPNLRELIVVSSRRLPRPAFEVQEIQVPEPLELVRQVGRYRFMYLDASPDEVLGAVEREKRSFAFRVGKDVPGSERVDSEPLLRLLVDLPREGDETPLHRVVETERILWGVLEALLLPERIVSVVLEARIHRNPVPHPHEVVEDLIELRSA